MQDYIDINTVRSFALQEGLCDCGAARLHKVDIQSYKTWLSKGYNASMKYLSNNVNLRENPMQLFDNAKSIICFLYSYNDDNILVDENLKIASYAQRKDYHYVLKDKLRNIIVKMQYLIPNLHAVAFVDSAPILENYWAVKCGLGWKGKNSLLVTKDFGNKVFIGEIFTNCITDYAKEQKNHCGGCTACIDACPNHAILEDGNIDCNLCISYQTIENKQDINKNIDTNGFIYGCDICLNACIWNKKAKKVSEQDEDVKRLIYNTIQKIKANDFTKQDFNMLKKHTSISRIKYDKLLSNIAYNMLKKDDNNL